MVVLVTGATEKNWGMKGGAAVDRDCVMNVVFDMLVFVFTVSVLNVGYGLPEVILDVAAIG